MRNGPTVRWFSRLLHPGRYYWAAATLSLAGGFLAQIALARLMIGTEVYWASAWPKWAVAHLAAGGLGLLIAIPLGVATTAGARGVALGALCAAALTSSMALLGLAWEVGPL